MRVNNKEIEIEEIIKVVYDDKNLIKMRKNGIYLSDNQVMTLKRYGVDYTKYSSIKSLIFHFVRILNEETNLEDLEAVSKSLSEIDYYKNIKK